MKGGTKLCVSATVAAMGVVIAVIGVSFLHFFPVIFDETLKKQTRLVEGNMGYEIWKNPPADIYVDFYVWHLENPLEVEKGAKPNVTQRGPYTYKENRSKEFIQDNKNGTLSYIQPQRFIFDPVHSVGDPKIDNFTTINMPLLTIVNHLQYMPENYRYLFDMIATMVEKHLHATHTVHDFIWGYFSPLLFLAKMLEPDMVPKDSFGIYIGKNTTYDGIYTVYDGVRNYTETNEIEKWKGMDRVSYWTTKYANMINGTDGTYFGQFLSKEEKVYIFVSDICRSVYATFKQDMETRRIPTWRYTVPKPVFDNHYVEPTNSAFCTPDKKSCLPGGILNITDCQFGAPIYFSSPHFLYSDDEVLDMINGVHPNETLHQTFVDIEPYSGAPLKVAKRSQINTYIRSYDFIEFYKEVPEAYLPLVWMEERSFVTKEAASQLEQQLMLPLAIGKYVPWTVFSFGLLLVLVGVGCSWRQRKEWKGSDGLNVNTLMTDEDG
ncbi:lysosome membrane protein 2 [Strongylocentrotus purpuratus]|uniref:Scavenger receptor class B member 1 n=1 Tax=Strongylocentrotus purpuratus TaxID=7668 RepID=A0A7M7NIF8_STRPU|nr:lysosome membrane protein 2 [Strongylocentrotus purpuratus]